MTVRKTLTLMASAGGSAAAGAVATLAVAWLVPSPMLFLGAGWLTAAAAWLTACRLQRSCPIAHRVLGIAGLSIILVAVQVPLGDPAHPPAPPPGAGRWSLSDGAWLSYGVVRARPGAATATPVVVVHGGPGVPDLAGFLSVLSPLAVDGHDVWAYEQRGSGRSSRLSDPRRYSVQQAVEDLEQVRLRTGGRRMILIGHSYGAYLAAAYLAAHPDRVEKMVLSSPGDLDRAGLGGSPQSRLGLQDRLHVYALLSSPRALLTYALVQVNPAAAHALVGDREADARQDRVYAASRAALHCPGRTGPALHGLGFYANAVPQSLQRPAVPDVAAALRGTRVPALVIRGQCDYLDRQAAAAYLAVFSDSTLCYLPGAGHESYMDTPGAYLSAVRSFVAAP